MKYQIFGSQDSKDYDVLVFEDSILPQHDGITRLNELNLQLASEFDGSWPSKVINSNTGVLQEGKLIAVQKGTFDEVNNSLLATYHLHPQKFERQVFINYDRINGKFFELKMIRVARFILSFYSRIPELRSQIKTSLKGNLGTRINALKDILAIRPTAFPGKNEKHDDIVKVIAFQLAQSLGLVLGIEIYTKSDAILHFPTLRTAIERQPMSSFDWNLLYDHLETFISEAEKLDPTMIEEIA